jgi:gliding motility-associated-like protein
MHGDAASAFVPSAFTPNGDGLNDKFEMDILGATTINVKIWDRWGELVFSNPDQANGMSDTHGWDGTFRGKPVQFDTYTYQLVITYSDGHEQTVAGTLSVLR